MLQDIIKVKHLYIKEIKSKEQEYKVKVLNHIYSYFQVIDETNKIIDEYDFINIIGKARVDIEDNITRLFPFWNNSLYYDLVTHTIIDKEKYERIIKAEEQGIVYDIFTI